MNISINKDHNFDYKVQLIDHNVNILELSCDQELIIKENDYEIINLNKIETIENKPEQLEEQNDEQLKKPEQLEEKNDEKNEEKNEEKNNIISEEPEYISL